MSKRKCPENMEDDTQSEGSFSEDESLMEDVSVLEDKLDLLLEKFEALEKLLKQSNLLSQ